MLGGAPDLIVDATGRARTVARLLDLPTVEGPRKDTALHAHCTGVPLVLPGNVHSDRLERGWSWRIPLPGRVSVGVVVPSEHIAAFGNSAEEQFDSFLRRDDCARQWGEKAERITPVVRYTNYQLRATRGVGPELGAGGRRVRLRRSGAVERAPDRVRRRARAGRRDPRRHAARVPSASRRA